MKSPQVRQLNTWCLFLLLTWCLYRVLEPFLTPLCWAAVLGMYFYPLHKWVGRRIRGRNLAALGSTGLVTLVLIVPAALVLPFVIGEAIHMLGELPSSELMARLDEWIRRLPIQTPTTLEQMVVSTATEARGFLVQESALIAGNVALRLFNVGLALFALFYFLRDGKSLVNAVRGMTYIDPANWERLINDVFQMVQVTVSMIFLVAGLQGTAGALVFWLFGVSSPIVSGLSMAASSMIPVVGALLVWVPVSVWFIIKGATARGVAILVVGLIVVLAIDNLIRPLLISGQSRLNPLLVLISVLGGLQAFGALGLVLGPVVTTVAVALLHTFLTRPETMSEEPASPSPGATASYGSPD